MATGIFQALFGSGGDRSREQKAFLELLLVAALADGQLTQGDFDRLARAMETHEELRGVDWDWVIDRARELEEDAPLFFETRKRIAKELKDPNQRRSALSLAAKFLGSPLREEEQALLHGIAEVFGINQSERPALFQPWTEANPFELGYRRCSFNNPDAPRFNNLFHAIENAEDDEELALLVFKLCATRSVMNRFSEAAELVAVGSLIEVGEQKYRLDAFLQADRRSWMIRCLGKGEALYPREHEILPALLDRVDSSVSLFIAYEGAIPPQDVASLKLLNPDRLITEKTAA